MSARAWSGAFVLLAAAGLAGLAVLAPRAGQVEAPAACRSAVPEPARPLPCLDGLAPTILSAELAGTRQRWSCQLYRGAPVRPGLEDTRCAEGRAAGLRDELRQFDNRFFIPLYTALSLLLAGWLATQGAGRGGAPRRRLQALALALATALLAALDGRENRAALAVLDAMDAWGAAAVTGGVGPSPGDAAIDALARLARQRSLEKWAASALWAALLAGALAACLRDAAALAARQRGAAPQPATRRWWVAAGALALAATAGGALFAAGAGAAWSGERFAAPVRLIQAGMGMTMGSLVGAALATALAWWAGRRTAAGHSLPDPAGR